MNEQTVTPKPRWRRILRKIFIGVAIFVAVIITSLAIWNFIAARQLKNEIAKIRAVGQPITLADLEAELPQVSEADNAARFYLAGLDLLVSKNEIGNLHGNPCSGKQCPTTAPTTLLSKTELEKAQTLLSANQPALDLFDQGAELPAVRSDL
jgi:HAMP domain-containing protein